MHLSKMKSTTLMLFITALVAIMLVSGCKEEDKIAPKATVDSPADGDRFASGATIAISGKVTDDAELKEAVIEVHSGPNNTVVFSKKTEVSGKSATVTANYVLNLGADSTFEVHVIVTDKAGNSGSWHTHAYED
jgi:uncharacterized lipoprotein YajG